MLFVLLLKCLFNFIFRNGFVTLTVRFSKTLLAQTWTWVGFTHGLGWAWVVFFKFLWVRLGWVRREQLHIIQQLEVKYWTPAFTTSTLYFSKIVTAQYAFNLLSFQVFDLGLLWSWIHIGFQTRYVDIQLSCSDRFLDLNYLFMFISN